MDTISHGLWAFLFFRNRRGLLLFILGTIFLDLPYIIGGIYHLFIKPGISIKSYFNMLNIPTVKYTGYFFHSIVIWGIIFALVWKFSTNYLPFLWGWLFHLAIDVLTHHSDSTPIFWPISHKAYPALISYWEPKYYGPEFTVLELTVLVAILMITFLKK